MNYTNYCPCCEARRYFEMANDPRYAKVIARFAECGAKRRREIENLTPVELRTYEDNLREYEEEILRQARR